MDLISVIVPVYNVEKYLHRCVDSILAQTYANLEIILIDDGSSDNCPVICDEYAEKDSRIKVIHKENGGLSSARNAGLDIATGDYIGFVDSDDYIALEMYEKLYSALIESEADMSLCKYVQIDENRNILLCDDLPVTNATVSSDIAIRWLELDNGKCFVIACNKLFRSRLFEEIRFPVGKYCEDNFIIHEIYHKCKTVTAIDNELYYYIQRSDSILHAAYDIRMADMIEGFYRRICYFKQNDIHTDMLPHYHYLLWAYRDFKVKYKIKSKHDKERLNEIETMVSEIRQELGDNISWKEKLCCNCFPLYKILWFFKNLIKK